jgi:hypothetical protein
MVYTVVVAVVVVTATLCEPRHGTIHTGVAVLRVLFRMAGPLFSTERLAICGTTKDVRHDTRGDDGRYTGARNGAFEAGTIKAVRCSGGRDTERSDRCGVFSPTLVTTEDDRYEERQRGLWPNLSSAAVDTDEPNDLKEHLPVSTASWSGMVP